MIKSEVRVPICGKPKYIADVPAICRLDHERHRMNSQAPQSKNNMPESIKPEASASTEASLPESKTGFLSILARIGITQISLVLLALILLWQWQSSHRSLNNLQQQFAKFIYESGDSGKTHQLLLAQNQEQMRELAAKLATLETRFVESHNQRIALENLYSDIAASREEVALAEVEQMLLLAEQQIQLTANSKGALIAMQNADLRLQRMNQPAYISLRKAISQDIDKLRALPNADIAGFKRQLDLLATTVDALPLIYQQHTAFQKPEQFVAPKDETIWRKLKREIGYEIEQLVRIESTEKKEIPLLPPNQEYFLRENLRLRLMSARLALMSRDEEGFRHELKTAQLWVVRYFDGKSIEGKHMLSELFKLSAARIHIALPDISHSLQAIHNYRLEHEREPKFNSDLRRSNRALR